VIQARLNLEYGDYDFLQSMDSSTLKGFSQAIKIVDVQEEKLLEILSTSIAVCNDAVQLSPGDRAFSLETLESSGGDTAYPDEAPGQHRKWIADSMTVLECSVASLRSLWRPSHYIVDQKSTSIICKEANRLSRIKQALLESEDDEDIGTEYGCDCGCWSVFATKRELLDLQKSCRGDAAAIGEHERFERMKGIDACSIRPVNFDPDTIRKQVRALNKLEAAVLQTEGDMTNWNVPRMPCWEVEYGCSHHGCSCVFASRRELVDHETSCGDKDGASRPGNRNAGEDTEGDDGMTRCYN